VKFLFVEPKRLGILLGVARDDSSVCMFKGYKIYRFHMIGFQCCFFIVVVHASVCLLHFLFVFHCCFAIHFISFVGFFLLVKVFLFITLRIDLLCFIILFITLCIDLPFRLLVSSYLPKVFLFITLCLITVFHYSFHYSVY